jgi:hypothetical protein
MSLQFHDSGRVNSKIKVFDLRDPEIKQKARTCLQNWICFEGRKSIVAHSTKLQSFQSFGRGQNQKAIFRFQVSKIENCEG